jgi:hypothetical protein
MGLALRGELRAAGSRGTPLRDVWSIPATAHVRSLSASPELLLRVLPARGSSDRIGAGQQKGYEPTPTQRY